MRRKRPPLGLGLGLGTNPYWTWVYSAGLGAGDYILCEDGSYLLTEAGAYLVQESAAAEEEAEASARALVSGYQTWWAFDEGSGSTIGDDGSDATPAAFQGVADSLWFYTGPGGDASAVGYFAGADSIDYCNNIGNSVHIAGSANDASMTFHLCFYCEEVHAMSAYNIIGKYDDADVGNWRFEINTQQLRFNFYDSEGTEHQYALRGTLSANTWYYLALRFYCDSIGTWPQWIMYASATSAASAVSGGWVGGDGQADPTGNDNYILIGAHNNDGSDGSGGTAAGFKGMIGDIVVYNSYLASADVQTNFRYLKARYATDFEDLISFTRSTDAVSYMRAYGNRMASTVNLNCGSADAYMYKDFGADYFTTGTEIEFAIFGYDAHTNPNQNDSRVTALAITNDPRNRTDMDDGRLVQIMWDGNTPTTHNQVFVGDREVATTYWSCPVSIDPIYCTFKFDGVSTNMSVYRDADRTDLAYTWHRGDGASASAKYQYLMVLGSWRDAHEDQHLVDVGIRDIKINSSGD